jgi:putative transposase
MPWQTETPVTVRTQFIAEHLRRGSRIGELCEKYGVSRKTGWKWIQRYMLEGPEALGDRSRRPDSHPNQTPSRVVEALLKMREAHPGYGARKLLNLLEAKHGEWEFPNPSTVYDIFRRHGVRVSKKNRRRPGHPGRPAMEVTAANQVWSADFKGQFRMGNGQYCYPLTITDNFSRYLLCCHGQLSTNLDDTKRVMERVFQEYGLPERIRTDNGVPFASEALGRLSRLSAWWIQLGIVPELIEPGKPQQNGRHERMHRTLKAATARPPGSGLRSQQNRFDAFQQEYNHERPHEALGMETPSVHYQASTRLFRSTPGEYEYPGHYETRYVSFNGGIRWKNRWVRVSTVLMGHHVGLEEVEDGIWDVYFCTFKLGKLLEKHMRIEDGFGRLTRK